MDEALEEKAGGRGDPNANYKEPLVLDIKGKGCHWTVMSFVLRSLTMVVSVMPGVADVTTLNGIRMFYPSGDKKQVVAAEGAPEPSAETSSEDEDDSGEDISMGSSEEAPMPFVPSQRVFPHDDSEESPNASASVEEEPAEMHAGEEVGTTFQPVLSATDDHTVQPDFVAGGDAHLDIASFTPPPQAPTEHVGGGDAHLDVASFTPPQQAPTEHGGGGVPFEIDTETTEQEFAAPPMTLQEQNEALAVQVVACRFLLSIYTIDALCMAVGKIMQFEVLWLIEERHACRFNYIVFTLILTLTEITIEFLASAVTPLIYRIVTKGAPLTSKRLAIFSLQAYSASATVSLIIYPPLGFAIHVLGGFDSAASFFFVMIFWGIQYAFMNQIGDAAVEMARPHWFRTFKGLSLTVPGVPFFCCCDRFVVKAWRHKLAKRADSHRDGVLENPGMAHVVREQIHSLQGELI